MRLCNSQPSQPRARAMTHSGRDIFCKPEKKSLFRIVAADSTMPDRFATSCFASSGNATPSVTDTRSSGLSASGPCANISCSNVSNTANTISAFYN